jgi:transcriptional regulator with XRE-family HTH domain
MIIADRLRALREEKKFSQGEIEKRAGLLRCHVSESKTATRSPTSKR